MDKLGKFLAKLVLKEREAVKQILLKLAKGTMAGLDIKKLKGRQDIFRVRKGDIRIIYRQNENGLVFILRIDRRKEDTYKF